MSFISIISIQFPSSFSMWWPWNMKSAQDLKKEVKALKKEAKVLREERWLEALKKLETEALLKKDGLTARHLKDLMKKLLAKSLETEETEGLAEI
ncbi:UNVERIFIED_CONTAM: hypothetical protein Slati_2570200 [Sesamum latifolium]|uniref:Uncharacterized protein n=1 Tax=Sesamum latifolium TaxID=2727402 RepID=A0AAW2VTZ0_9LAMI